MVDGQWSMVNSLLTMNYILLAMDYQLWTINYGLLTMDYQLWTINYGLSTTEIKQNHKNNKNRL
jgi:hypothetical protein